MTWARARWPVAAVAAAGVAVVVVAAAVVVSHDDTQPAPSRATAPPTTPAPTLQLIGDDLGVTRIGDSKARAIAAVAKVLGSDYRTASVTSCPEARTEVVWDARGGPGRPHDLLLAFGADGSLTGWSVSTPRLVTAAGVHVGSTVAELSDSYHGALIIIPGSPDSGFLPRYAVTGISMVGDLTGDKPTDHVTALANGSCTGP